MTPADVAGSWPALTAQLALPQLLQIPEVDKQTKQLPRLLF